MKSPRRILLLIINSTVVLAGAAAMFVVVLATTDELAASRRNGAGTEAPVVKLQDRLAHFEPRIAPKAPPAPQPPPAAEPAEPEEQPSWSVETKAEGPPTPDAKVSWLPAIRLPWQSPKPDASKIEPPKQSYTLKTRLAEISPAVTPRLAEKFASAKVEWPPSEIALIAIKDEKALELYAKPASGAWSFIHRYRILAASGAAGPKLRQGDRQVPEGIYGIEFLNPNSAYHVAMRVNYPNAFDRRMASQDGRKELGGDIMIHGKNLSAGCLAMGDDVAEELFVLAAQTGLTHVKIIIAPTDFRQNGLPAMEAGRPQWLPQLYTEIAGAMSTFNPPPRGGGLLSFIWK